MRRNWIATLAAVLLVLAASSAFLHAAHHPVETCTDCEVFETIADLPREFEARPTEIPDSLIERSGRHSQLARHHRQVKPRAPPARAFPLP